MKHDYKITVEIPREVKTKHGTDITVDTYTQFIYGRKNKESALRSFGSVKNLKYLRHQGLRLTRQEFKQYKKQFDITQL